MSANAVVHAMKEASEQSGAPTMPAGFHFNADDWLVYESPDDDDAKPVTICSRLEVVARTTAPHGGGHGYLLRFPTDTGFTHEWAMPASMLKGSGEEYRGVMLDMGLMINATAKARTLLTAYIHQAGRQCAREDRLVTSTQRTGWHGDAYVLPGRVLGNASRQRLVYQRPELSADGYRPAGTLAEWQRQVAAPCRGNSRLLFAVAAAFAPAMLVPCRLKESFGFHFVGGSSIGKSTALNLANSVWGDPGELLETWNNTTNGLESIAATRNDALLTLDELHQCDPRAAGKSVYMLAEGRGKGRSKETGALRDRARWRLVFLSSGELSTADHIASEGGRSYAGQAVRAIVLRADAGAGRGLFETTHGASGADFANQLDRAARDAHGHAGAAFIECLATNQPLARQAFSDSGEHFKRHALPPGASGQVRRVADKFALVAAAGTLASAWGITGWQSNEVSEACVTLFREWLADRGTSGDDEPRRAFEQIRAFIERHGESRFSPLDTPRSQVMVRDRAGYIGEHQGRRCVMFTSDGWKEACQGFGYRQVAKWLADGGYLLTDDNDGRRQRQIRLPGHQRPIRLYVVPVAILEADEGE
ncbi:DUF927 domain-containing protein [Halomonas sp. LBP4]|uniref:DUF927 domain-containing protein n=1 Tax=Halomonas sp. LBP4 TaxID=2044917 RepID=UPI000D761EE4|nr:DUF927 domain-containing protein [Halomonas sp. LBP4]PXX94991.1 hypothetical protein CR157_20465 [Halomonas sp. LBP4]